MRNGIKIYREISHFQGFPSEVNAGLRPLFSVRCLHDFYLGSLIPLSVTKFIYGGMYRKSYSNSYHTNSNIFETLALI